MVKMSFDRSRMFGVYSYDDYCYYSSSHLILFAAAQIVDKLIHNNIHEQYTSTQTVHTDELAYVFVYTNGIFLEKNERKFKESCQDFTWIN